MTHEAVEVLAVVLLPKGDLHRPPVLLVEARLLGGVQTHQDEVADQVSLTQRAASRVHALEDELRVVLIAAEGDVHDHELCEPLAQRRKVGPDRLHPLLEEVEVLHDAERGLGRLRFLLHQGE